MLRNRPLSEVALSFSSWFCIPDQGMKDFEILCRASAFLLPASAKWTQKEGTKYHVLTAAHAAAPWKFPKLYDNDWLKFVTQHHTHFTLETRGPDGSALTQLELLPRAYYHPKRDLAVLHLEDEEQVYDLLDVFTVERELKLCDKDHVDLDKELTFYGYDVEKQLFGSPNQQNGMLRFPQVVKGTPVFRSPHQIFCATKPVLTDGMCGGPVCIRDHIKDGDHKIICGLTEGIVPDNFPSVELRNTGVFVEAGEIREFLRAVENEEVEPLVGGYAQDVVGSDQDPTKMDLERILGGG